MKRSTIYLLTTILFEILLIVIFIKGLISPLSEKGANIGFGFFHLLYCDLSSGIWVFPSMFVFLASVPILCIGCVFGVALCLLKNDY